MAARRTGAAETTGAGTAAWTGAETTGSGTAMFAVLSSLVISMRTFSLLGANVVLLLLLFHVLGFF